MLDEALRIDKKQVSIVNEHVTPMKITDHESVVQSMFHSRTYEEIVRRFCMSFDSITIFD
jgi:hypothetical protein